MAVGFLDPLDVLLPALVVHIGEGEHKSSEVGLRDAATLGAKAIELQNKQTASLMTEKLSYMCQIISDSGQKPWTIIRRFDPLPATCASSTPTTSSLSTSAWRLS